MSTNTITTTSAGPIFDRAAGTPAKTGSGFFGRLFQAMIAAREAQAKRMISYYVSRMSEQERKDLGYPASKDL